MGWTVLESNPGCGDTSAPLYTGPEAYPGPVNLYQGSLQVIKRPGFAVNHPTYPSAEVKERVEYNSTAPRPLVPSWHTCIVV